MECSLCTCAATIVYVLVDRFKYLNGCHDLELSRFHSDSAPLTELKMLGCGPFKSTKATKAVVNYLEDTNVVSIL